MKTLRRNIHLISTREDEIYKNLIVDLLGVDSISNSNLILEENIKYTHTELADLRKDSIPHVDTALVLIGANTWKSMNVDIEIATVLSYKKLRDKAETRLRLYNKPSVLVCLILPSHPDYELISRKAKKNFGRIDLGGLGDRSKDIIDRRTIPIRALDNLKSHYADIFLWIEKPRLLTNFISSTSENTALKNLRNNRDLFPKDMESYIQAKELPIIKSI